MSRICFVSYEIHPTTWGGCGVLLHNAARVLLSQGHEVVFLLDIPAEHFHCFRDEHRLDLPHPENCRAYHVDALCANTPLRENDFPGLFTWKAYRFDFACRQVCALEHPDAVEFFDYCGVAHYALSAKAAGLDYRDTHLAVRLHNTCEVMDVHEATKPLSFDRYMLYALEHGALRLAETVLYPSPSYLKEGCRQYYEPWFGRTECSQSPLVVRPQAAPPRSDADIALFFGRLFAWKGVDVFVDAAVAYLENPANPPLRFYLVGNDSGQPPIKAPNYQAYLLRKIPARHCQSFVFTGWLDWNQMASLLPQVRFGVFPSYFESFCYALHEVYLAQIPVIVSDMPGTKDFFRHEQNALLFDGSVEGLTRQMERLARDAELHKKITLPYQVATDPLGTFYSGPFAESWISREEPTSRPSVLVCVMEDKPGEAAPTLDALADIRVDNMRIVCLRPAENSPEEPATWLLGALRTLHDERGTLLLPTDVRTAETLLILRVGDLPSPEYLSRCVDTLARQPRIAFVGSWKRLGSGRRARVDTFPLDAAVELVPFRKRSPLSRCLMRTAPDRLLIDLFPASAGAWGELAYLWDLATENQCGLTIPEVLITQRPERPCPIEPSTLTYLVLRDTSVRRKGRLARHLVDVWMQATHPKAAANSDGKPKQTLYRRLRSIGGRAKRRLLRLGKTMSQ